MASSSQRFVGFRHTPVAPRCSSPECDTTRTVAHHTGSGVVAFFAVDVRVSCFYRDSCAKKAAAFFKKSIPRPGFAQLGFDFLVLGKLGRCHFLGLGSGMGFPPLVHPVSHGLRDQAVGLCHLSDRAGAFQRPPDTTCCLNSSLYFDADIIQILPHVFD